MAASLVLSAHIETCSICRNEVSALEEAEGERLERGQPADMAFDALDRALTAINAALPHTDEVVHVAEHLGDVPLPIAVARVGFKARRFLGPAFWAAPIRIPEKDGWRGFLLRLPARTSVPTDVTPISHPAITRVLG
jgi:anti-sigma factor ChrR (cupin superfamily)